VATIKTDKPVATAPGSDFINYTVSGLLFGQLSTKATHSNSHCVCIVFKDFSEAAFDQLWGNE
jgi:hypothetical protein